MKEYSGYTYKVAQAKPVFSGITCNLYPNPSREKTNISFSKIPDGTTKIRVTDIQGKVVLEKEEQLNVGQVEIVTSSFPAGLYNVQVFVNKIEIFKTKLEVSI